MTILAFSGSNSAKSINQQLLNHLATRHPLTVIDLRDYDAPMYCIDDEEQSGIPAATVALNDQIAAAETLVISVAEHNGNISAFFKNHLDWLSRHNRQFLAGKNVIILGTSPGQNGAATAVNICATTLPFFGARIVATLPIGNFYDIFTDGVLNDEIAQQFAEALSHV